MKKILIFLITISFISLFCTKKIDARAGGGGSGGGGSGRSSRRVPHRHYFHHKTYNDSIRSGLIIIFSHAFIWYTIIIIKKRHIIKAKIKTKYYMKERGIDYKDTKKGLPTLILPCKMLGQLTICLPLLIS